jgi:hypothetical protein
MGTRALVIVLLHLVGCAEVSGLSDFEVVKRDGGGGSPGAGGAAEGGAAAGGNGGAPLVTGPFGAMAPVAEINSVADDDDPSFTADGLELVFNSNRGGNIDIFGSTRASVDDPWGTPTALAELNTGTIDGNPVIAPDGLSVWLSSDRATLNLQIYVATRQRRTVQFSSPVAVAEFASSSKANACAVSADGLQLIIESDVNGADDLFMTTRTSVAEPWATPLLIDSIDMIAGPNREAWLSPNALHLYWGKAATLWRASRADTRGPFVGASEVGELTPLGQLSDPWLSPDQRYIMFSVGTDPREIYEARR